MDFEKELKKQKLNIRKCSEKSKIPYATLYPIIKGQVDIGTCSYYTVEKLARALGYSTDEIVYHPMDFQVFRNDLHHDIKRDELGTVLSIIEDEQIEYYHYHRDYTKMLYLLATVDLLCRKNDIPLCDKYSSFRTMCLEKPYWVGDSEMLNPNPDDCIEEFKKYNIMEGDLYDAV